MGLGIGLAVATGTAMGLCQMIFDEGAGGRNLTSFPAYN